MTEDDADPAHVRIPAKNREITPNWSSMIEASNAFLRLWRWARGNRITRTAFRLHIRIASAPMLLRLEHSQRPCLTPVRRIRGGVQKEAFRGKYNEPEHAVGAFFRAIFGG